jgi:hypothetical protein
MMQTRFPFNRLQHTNSVLAQRFITPMSMTRFRRNAMADRATARDMAAGRASAGRRVGPNVGGVLINGR